VFLPVDMQPNTHPISDLADPPRCSVVQDVNKTKSKERENSPSNGARGEVSFIKRSPAHQTPRALATIDAINMDSSRLLTPPQNGYVYTRVRKIGPVFNNKRDWVNYVAGCGLFYIGALN
jgi:hypothetical protein